MFKKYQITLHGCDDSTYIEWDLTEDEYKLLKHMADDFERKSSYVCMPTMELKEIKE